MQTDDLPEREVLLMVRDVDALLRAIEYYGTADSDLSEAGIRVVSIDGEPVAPGGGDA